LLHLLAGGVAETEENPLRRTKQTRARANQFLHIIDFFGFSPLNSNKNEKCENEKNLSLASLYTQKRPHRCSESPFLMLSSREREREQQEFCSRKESKKSKSSSPRESNALVMS
jgi:hypothetical protein